MSKVFFVKKNMFESFDGTDLKSHRSSTSPQEQSQHKKRASDGERESVFDKTNYIIA